MNHSYGVILFNLGGPDGPDVVALKDVRVERPVLGTR